MFKNILILLFFLCVCGLSCGQNFVEYEGGNADTTIKREDEGGSRLNSMIRIPKGIIKFVIKVVKTILKDILKIPDEVVKNIVKFIENILGGGTAMASKMMNNAKSMVMDTLGYLASSDDTDMSYARANMSPEEFAEYQRTHSNRSFGSKISKLFMKPFKMIFGTARSLPVKVICDKAKLMLSKPIGMIMSSPIAQSMASNLMRMADNVVSQCWSFTKKQVLPRMDKFIKKLKDSNSLPPAIMVYLDDLQSLYHVLKVVGVA